MKVGDRVRLIGVPPDIEDLPTKLTFQKCLGKDFTVAAINATGHAELQIESITGTSDDKIYVPPRFLQVISR